MVIDREDTLRRTVTGELEAMYKNQLVDVRMRTDKRIDGLVGELTVAREKYEQLIVSTNSRAQNSSVKGQDGENFVFATVFMDMPTVRWCGMSDREPTLTNPTTGIMY